MADMLKTGSDWLASKLKSHASQTIVYRRGVQSVTVSATIGRTEFEDQDSQGIIHRIESRDYLIHAADLIINGQTITPQRGDQIDEEQGGQLLTFEVQSPGGEPVFRYSDQFRKLLRIHTKLYRAS